MTDIVDETLSAWRQGHFSYGQDDCWLSIGRYLARTGHDDVTPQFVGRYSTQEGAIRQMDAHGGACGLMALAGAIPKQGIPSRGDVVEVIYDDDDGQHGIGGLCTGGFVAVRLERGVVEVRTGLLTIGGVWHGSR